MSDTTFPDGSLALCNKHLVRINTAGSINGARGHHIIDIGSTGDPGTTWGHLTNFVGNGQLKAAVIGETVCAKGNPLCGCGLAHLTREQLRWIGGGR